MNTVVSNPRWCSNPNHAGVRCRARSASTRKRCKAFATWEGFCGLHTSRVKQLQLLIAETQQKLTSLKAQLKREKARERGRVQ